MITRVSLHHQRFCFCLLAVLVTAIGGYPWSTSVAKEEAVADSSAWTDLIHFLVASDGGYGRADTGGKIVYFDTSIGDNATGEAYWWDGRRIVDSAGNATNVDGLAYGTDPLQPNEKAVKPFRTMDLKGHPLLRPRAGCPDWYLLRRGQTHDTFNGGLAGGRSEAEPMVVAAYGPLSDGRGVIEPKDGRGPFGGHNGGSPVAQFHQVLTGLELHCGLSHLGMHADCTSPGEPGVPTWLIEDCKIINGQMNYLPVRTTLRKSVSAFRWSAKGHNQGYFTSGFQAAPTFEEVIFYKNGYKTDPMNDPDPRRTIFDRNIYQGGGARMGHTYRNIISADGGSGGPQMRLGGLIENSLIIEGYWFSGTSSNKAVNPWLIEGAQEGCSTIVRNNVQFLYAYPSPADPDTDDRSDKRAQPGNGYTVQGASFGGIIEDNIVSGAMLTDDLGFAEHARAAAYKFAPTANLFQDGKTYTAQRCTIRGNIGYRTSAGLGLGEDWTGAEGHVAEGNVFVANAPVAVRMENITSPAQLTVRNNRFYANQEIPEQEWIGEDNTLAPYDEAAAKENWPDPNRTLKRYTEEVLNLTLLDWADDPWLDSKEAAKRSTAGEAYDPTGLKTFMAVATNMRKGGVDRIPSSGKPSWKGDYPWDARFTGQAVVNWIRAGFNLPALGD